MIIAFLNQIPDGPSGSARPVPGQMIPPWIERLDSADRSEITFLPSQST